ncbi:MAG: hypothetical protein ABJM43_17965 [Paracoccaceae bacterium]
MLFDGVSAGAKILDIKDRVVPGADPRDDFELKYTRQIEFPDDRISKQNDHYTAPKSKFTEEFTSEVRFESSAAERFIYVLTADAVGSFLAEAIDGNSSFDSAKFDNILNHINGSEFISIRYEEAALVTFDVFSSGRVEISIDSLSPESVSSVIADPSSDHFDFG